MYYNYQQPTSNPITDKDKISFLEKCIEFIQKHKNEDKEKYSDALYCYVQLMNNLMFPSKKIPIPSKKQRKNAIEVTVEIEEHMEINENIKQRDKAIAEILKHELDKQR